MLQNVCSRACILSSNRLKLHGTISSSSHASLELRVNHMETSMGQVVSKVDEVLKRLEGHEDDGSKSRGGSASSSRTGSGISRGMRDIASAKGESGKARNV